jgi:hypothetical protein
MTLAIFYLHGHKKIRSYLQDRYHHHHHHHYELCSFCLNFHFLLYCIFSSVNQELFASVISLHSFYVFLYLDGLGFLKILWTGVIISTQEPPPPKENQNKSRRTSCIEWDSNLLSKAHFVFFLFFNCGL